MQGSVFWLTDAEWQTDKSREVHRCEIKRFRVVRQNDCSGKEKKDEKTVFHPDRNMTEILKDSLHTVSQWLLIPTMAILLLLIAGTVACLGGIIVEGIRERSVVKENVSALILGIHGKKLSEIKNMIIESRIYARHKDAIFTIIDNGNKPEELLVAASRRIIADEDAIFEKRAARVEMASRVAPMFGLMGTLIPLGPGLMALGQGDTMSLADSLLIAFDTTVAGLAAAAVCYVIAKIKRRWYDDYMVSLETLMDAVLEEISSEKALHGTVEEFDDDEIQDADDEIQSDVSEGPADDKKSEEAGI